MQLSHWIRERSSTGRLSPSLVGVALLSMVAIGCSSDTGQSEDDGPGRIDVGTVDTAEPDVSPDTGTTDTTPLDTGPTNPLDTGTTDTRPEGSKVSPSGFAVLPPRPASCKQPGAKQRIPFYFSNGDDQSPVVKWDRLNDRPLVPNTGIGAGSVEAKRARVSKQAHQTCSSSADCPDPMRCGASGLREAKRYCTFPTSVEFVPGSAQMDYRPNLDDDSGQLVTFLVENTTSYSGQLPNSVATRYGENGEIDTGQEPGRATDPRRKHREALRTFSDYMPGAVNEANTKISLWYYGGTSRVNARPVVRPRDSKDHFQNSVTLLKSWVKNQIPEFAARPANTYQSILRVVQQDFAPDKYEDHEKFLFVITDGPNEVYDDKSTRTKVLSKLKQHDVHLIVLHLDSQVEPDLLRDVPSYWKDSPPCEDDSDCAGHETCRRAKKYPKDKSGSVEKSSLKHCMPEYNERGHLGPVEAYADLACRTQGHYLYLDNPQQMVWYAKRLPYLMDGQWSVEAELSAFDERLGLGSGYYRLSGVFFGLIGANLSSVLSDVGPEGHPLDTRPLLRLQRQQQ